MAVGKDELIDSYLNALEHEISRLGEPQRVQTLFLGGGTPSYLSTAQLERLLGILERWLPLDQGGEFSIEANPGTLDREKVALLAQRHVNRVSIGAQSFRPALLELLARDHGADEIARAVDAVRSRITNVSLDLIFGVPGQSLGDWKDDLNRAIDLEPGHISTYGLTYEKGTPLWKQQRSGGVVPLGEDLEREMYEHAMEALSVSGFEQYEISNFARPGQTCLHNLVYWANEAYFGFGLGAARYVDGVRATNTRDLHKYIECCTVGRDPTQNSERLEGADRARETMAVQLRRARGIVRAPFALQTGYDFDSLAPPTFGALAEQELIVDDGESVALTRAGRCVADIVIGQFLRS